MEIAHRDVGRRLLIGFLALVAVALVLALAPAASFADNEQLPSGFEDQKVANVGSATAFAFVPDGRILITSQLGQLYVYDGGTTHLALDLDALGRICNNIERGLLGVAVDPAFADQHYVYLFYTYKKTGACGTDQFDQSTQPVDRVSRFLLGDNDQVDPASEQVLIDNIPSPAGFHNAGDVQFGKDGYLYATVGDGGCNYQGGECGPSNTNARMTNVLLGKVLRVASDGSIPPNNPFVGAGSSRCNVTGSTVAGDQCQETFASGLRNPFRMAFDPSAATTRFFINDVGQETWEEVDVGQAGADYGWNVREGPCTTGSTSDCGPPPDGMTNPIYWYDHSAGCSSLNGGAFVPPGVWPSEYDSHYLYSDIVCQKIFDLAPDGNGGWSATPFGTTVPEPLGMMFGPNGSGEALYYASYYPGSLHRIVYTGNANRSPKAVAIETSTNGAVPLTTDFDASQSTDPDMDTLAYDWDFGDGSPHETTVQATHTYETPGVYTATVTVTDGNGGSDTATVRVDAGNYAATPTIESPAVDQKFAVGEKITLTGSATDPEDGLLPDSALTWEVIKHHASHTHPFLPPTHGNNIEITGPQPEDTAATTNTYLEVRLTATDSQGLSTTVTRDLRPQLVTVGFETVPSGLLLELNGFTAPDTFTSWQGWKLQVNAPDQPDAQGQGEVFVSWSDGGTQAHQITTPAADTTYTATFTRSYVRPRGASPQRIPLVPSYRPCNRPNSSHGSPLAFESCSPAQPASPYVTIGTPDVNGLPSRSVGLIRLRAIVGDSSTVQNEADVKVDGSITDVLDVTRDLADYTGELRVLVGIRLTDKQNGSSGNDTATTRDFSLHFTMVCAPTIGSDGSNCSANTTANSLIPGMVVEGKRAIWQISSVVVQDGGSDGLASTTPNGLFATQGLFVP